MKHLKILGLAVFVATAVTFAGAGTASATVLCSTTSTPCNQFKYQVGVGFDASLAKKAVFESIFGGAFVECAESTLKGKLAHEGSGTETVLGTIEKLTWGKCTDTTATVTNGFFEIHNIAGTDNGTVTGGNTEITLDIIGTCTYSVEQDDLGTLKGGAAPTLAIDVTGAKTAGGDLCPALAVFTAEYKITEPLPLYVEAE